MTISTKLRAAAAASVLAMGGFALASTAPALAHDHKSKPAKAQANIVQTAVGTGVHETLVAAVKAADLVDTLSSPGPFTVFAPTDDAFAALPDGTVSTLLQPQNKGQLQNVLTYHVVSGRVPASALSAAIKRHGGTYSFKTVAGEELTASFSGDNNIVITDGANRTSTVTMADVNTANGVIHVTNGVFLPG
ncbi:MULTISPECIES: fasciclin domain-containing protein [Qipengyuania]|uniref:Fasciclin domain-containing protein n=2 Tax=Qipengyuania TaxID=1855416 RepID=A0A9Q3XDK2_9SPHN|nr:MULTISPECIES: fasciclin domain-containing protein [Qipengyuania]MBY6218589.1 fasciclin domain-containing protein [Qipengyuania aquimaris]QZD93527.1 fasciclin domain-containing protein [Qipengyuania xiapuensis]UOR15660.1 fasciclin domain-containing protein [Qipengyuania aquimaris]